MTTLTTIYILILIAVLVVLGIIAWCAGQYKDDDSEDQRPYKRILLILAIVCWFFAILFLLELLLRW